MDDKMKKKDKIAFKIATMPINMKKATTYQLLKALEKKYPANYEVKKGIINYFIDNDMLKEAEEKQVQVCLKYRKFEDFCCLIALSFFIGKMQFLVFDIRILDWVISEKDKEVLERISEILRKYTLEIAPEKFIGELVPIEDNIVFSRANEYAFNNLYSNILSNIRENEFFAALLDIKRAFKSLNIIEALQLLISKEKIEILDCLSRKSLFFEKYYIECANVISKGLIRPLETMLLIKSEAAVVEFVKMLKEKKVDIKKGQIVKDDTFSIEEQRYQSQKRSLFIHESDRF
ncbi:hypothetical protein GINT2_000836 [Glugoides intestinalis]